MNTFRGFLGTGVILGVGLFVGNASANSITFAGSSGSGSASVTFTTDTNKLDVIITNTENASDPAGTIVVAQGLSGLSFDISDLGGLPTAFTELDGESFNPKSGASWTVSSGTALHDDSKSPYDLIDHWGFSASSSLVTLTALSGGQPDYLILPSSGTAGSGKSLAGPHSPYLLGPTTFVLTLNGLTPDTVLSASDFSNVNFTFGTGSGEGSCTGTAVPNLTPAPLPAAAWSGLSLLGALFVGGGLRRRVMQ